MSREGEIEDLYQELTTFVRRSREMSNDIHPGISLVAYSVLSQVAVDPELRAADLALHFGLDKSTMSRQLDQLIAAGLLRRGTERPGKRGFSLALTPAGRRVLSGAANRVRARMTAWLTEWSDVDIAIFGETLSRFNAALR